MNKRQRKKHAAWPRLAAGLSTASTTASTTALALEQLSVAAGHLPMAIPRHALWPTALCRMMRLGTGCTPGVRREPDEADWTEWLPIYATGAGHSNRYHLQAVLHCWRCGDVTITIDRLVAVGERIAFCRHLQVWIDCQTVWMRRHVAVLAADLWMEQFDVERA